MWSIVDRAFWPVRMLGSPSSSFFLHHAIPLPFRYLGKLSMGTMILGYDPEEGFSIFYVDNEGVRSKGKLFAVGSGSTYAYSILDAGYRSDMTVDEAKELGLRAIRHATYRDAFSGGFVNVYLVQASGWRRLARVDGGNLRLAPVSTINSSFANMRK